MNFIFRTFFTLLAVSIPLFGDPNPHLILYFDINKTLIASDKAGNKSVEEVLNELLAEKYKDYWSDSLDEPITFDEYVQTILVPGPRESRELRDERKIYTQHFIDYLLGQNHPSYQAVLDDYEAALMVLDNSNGMIFPSFYALKDHLDNSGISYSIILRSFGEEVFEVKDEINKVYTMFFNGSGTFREGKLQLEDDQSIEDPLAIYQFLRRIDHTAIHDDWNFWNGNSMFSNAGKPFYIDREDHETLPIFFDDNIREDDSTHNIIAPLDAVTNELIPIEQLIESGQALRVDTLKAILNNNYYINCVDEALHKHSQSKGP